MVSNPWLRINGIQLIQWTRIQAFDFEGILFCNQATLWSRFFASLPPSLHHGRTIVFRLHVESLLDSRGEPTFIRAMHEYERVVGIEDLPEGSFVLVVRSEEMRLKVEATVRSCETEKVRSLFVVQLEV